MDNHLIVQIVFVVLGLIFILIPEDANIKQS